MMKHIASLIVITASLSACSTRPREFRAVLDKPAAEQDAFEKDLFKCQIMVRRGIKGDFKTTAGQALAGGGGFMAAGSIAASALSTSTSLGTAIGTSAAFASVGGPLVGFGVSRIIRSKREKKYRASLNSCLSEYGYSVASWEKQKRHKKEAVKKAIAEMTEAPEQSAPKETEVLPPQ
jgi:hypothetical protein